MTYACGKKLSANTKAQFVNTNWRLRRTVHTVCASYRVRLYACVWVSTGTVPCVRPTAAFGYRSSIVTKTASLSCPRKFNSECRISSLLSRRYIHFSLMHSQCMTYGIELNWSAHTYFIRVHYSVFMDPLNWTELSNQIYKQGECMRSKPLESTE